jgi:hypothetical protein
MSGWHGKGKSATFSETRFQDRRLDKQMRQSSLDVPACFYDVEVRGLPQSTMMVRLTCRGRDARGGSSDSLHLT